MVDTGKAQKEADEAKKTTIAEQSKQVDYAAALDRKSRDLGIWEKRLTPKFQEKYPGEEMRFV